MSDLQTKIENLFTQKEFSKEDVAAIESCIDQLDSGKLRVCEPVNGDWVINEWAKKPSSCILELMTLS